MYGKQASIARTINNTYEIETKIGSGGCGSVYKAWHKRLGKHLVLKELKDSSRKSPEECRNEIEALKNIKNMYIPQVFDYLTEDNNSYTVMEYIEGESLDKLLAQGTYFPTSLIIKWYYQLALALETLHENNVCHRDIKPGNIIKTANGDACLIDYNTALVSGNKTKVVGRTAGYASPEQYEYFQMCSNAHKERMKKWSDDAYNPMIPGYPRKIRFGRIDWKLSDIYSLGATMYHLFTGKHPQISECSHTNPSGYMDINTCGENVMVLGEGADVWSVIERSTRFSPGERFSSAQELRTALQKLVIA